MSLLQRWRRPSTILGVICLLALGVVSVENLNFTDSLLGTSYHRTQTIWLVLGLIGMGLTASIDIVFIRKIAPTLYQVLVVLLVAVLAVGRQINFSRRWIELGPVNIQPSEFMKLSVILMLADWFDKRRAQQPSKFSQLLIPVGLMLLPVILINREPDLGTSLCVAFIALGVILYDGVERKTLIASALVALVAVGLAWQFGVIRDYQKGRAETWWATISDESNEVRQPTKDNWQSEQALWAIGSGRIWGRSDDDARHSVLRHVPFVHTDFALAPFAERFGLAGCLVLFSLYSGVVVWALRVADRAQERFDALVAIGVAGLVFWQFFINTGMVIGVLPVVGITLPLVSYGGSSTLTVLFACGFLLNIATRRKAR